MSYPADYSQEYEFMDGISDATYTDPSGKVDREVKVKKGALGTSDIQGATFGVYTGDVPFTIWLNKIINGTLATDGHLVVGTQAYTVIGILSEAPDGSKARIIARKERS